MSKEIKELVLKILDKAMEVSTTTKADICVDFNGTCGYFATRIYGKGHKDKGSKKTYDRYTYLDFERALEDLNNMHDEICKYEKA